jgi:hypothetical protein
MMPISKFAAPAVGPSWVAIFTPFGEWSAVCITMLPGIMYAEFSSAMHVW